MTLGQLIERLKRDDAKRVVVRGFQDPHSYRGYYDELAFEPAENVAIGAMLANAEWSLGREFTGYKGGTYRMHAHTTVYLARHGELGEELTTLALETMLAPKDPASAALVSLENKIASLDQELTTLRAKLAKAERRYEKLKGSKRFHAACAALTGLSGNADFVEAFARKGQGSDVVSEHFARIAVVYADALLARLGEDAGGGE